MFSRYIWEWYWQRCCNWWKLWFKRAESLPLGWLRPRAWLRQRRVPPHVQPEECLLSLLLPALYPNQTVYARIPDPLYVFQSRSASERRHYISLQAQGSSRGGGCEMRHPMPISGGDFWLFEPRSIREPTLYLYVFASAGTKMAFVFWKSWNGGSLCSKDKVKLQRFLQDQQLCGGCLRQGEQSWGTAANPERPWEWFWATLLEKSRLGLQISSCDESVTKITENKDLWGCGMSRYSSKYLNIDPMCPQIKPMNCAGPTRQEENWT